MCISYNDEYKNFNKANLTFSKSRFYLTLNPHIVAVNTTTTSILMKKTIHHICISKRLLPVNINAENYPSYMHIKEITSSQY